MSGTIERELLDAAKAVGILTANGGLNAAWFQHPDEKLSTILSNPDQRSAFLDLLDAVAPHADVPGLPAGEKWHPLLGNQPRGNLYLSVNSAGPVVFGLAGELKGGASPAASLRAHLPMVSINGSSVSAIAGKTAGPLDVAVRAAVNWKRSTGDAIDLKAIQIQIHLAPIDSHVNLSVMLEGLDVDGSGAHDTPLDAANLSSQAMQVVLGLVSQQFKKMVPAAGEATKTVQHLLPLLGIAGGSIPPFPFAGLLNGPSAIQGWFNSVLSPANAGGWFLHLSGLFGGVAAVSGSGTADDPWRIPIVPPNGAQPGVDAAFSIVSQKLHAGLRLSLAAGGANARLEVAASVLAMPLAGNGAAAVLPSASVVMRSPAGGGKLVNVPGTMVADALRAGMQWNGAALRPMLELLNVSLGSTNYDRIDLTNADSVVSAASGAVRDAILAALGGSAPAQSLAALAGLVKPSGDPAWPASFLIGPDKLVTNPTGAIAEVHRKALLDGTHNWGFLLAEAAKLIGIAAPVTGAGTPVNPWVVPLAPAGAFSLQLAAWNQQTSGAPSDVQKLRLGLRLAATAAPWQFQWISELLSFDLPQTGSGDVRIMGGQHAFFGLSPAGTTPPFGGMTVSADSIGVTMDWTPGSPMAMTGVVNNIALVENGTATNIASLHFPPSQPFHINDPMGSIGVSMANLETLFRLLLARALYSWAGSAGLAASVLLGLKGTLPGLQTDWPVLRDPGATGILFNDPLAALRDWLGRVAVNVSADGTPYLPKALDWLRGLLADELPALVSDGPPMANVPLAGYGVYEEPWRLPVVTTEGQEVELLAWLEPAGPPATWAAPLSSKITATGSFTTLLPAAQPLCWFSAAAREAFSETRIPSMAAALSNLASYFAASDGVVPVSSQLPNDPAWTTGTPLTSAHHKQPADPLAISQILAKITAWLPANRAVLLLGPAFSDQTIWNGLRAQANAAKPGSAPAGAAFNLRIPNVDPAAIDLNTVTTVADFYAADLQDDGTGDIAKLTMQIGRLVAKIGQLRPGVKVVLVAHSTAGVPAREWAAANPAPLAGLITIGTPHQGATLDPLLDWMSADAMRFLQRATPNLAAGPLKDAITHLCQALDQFLPPASPNGLPIPFLYPAKSFAGTGVVATGGVPALALGGPVTGNLFDLVRNAFAAQATAAAGAGTTPTHLGFAFRGELNVPDATAGAAGVEVTVRADAGRVKLQPAAPEPARPKHALTLMARLTDFDGWVTGGPSSFVSLDGPASEVRIRVAELGATIAPKAGGGVDVTPVARLHQAGFHGPTLPLVNLADVQAQGLLGAMLHELYAAGPSTVSPIGVFTGALSRLGLAVPDIHGGMGISADAVAAVQIDAAGFLAPRLLTALSSGPFLGFKGPAAGPWTMAIGGGPLELYMSHGADWVAGVRIAAATPLTLGGSASLSFDARMHVPSLTAELDLSFSIGSTTLSCSAAGALSISAPPWLDPLTLPPAGPALTAAVEKAIPRILLSSAVTSLFEGVLGPAFRIAPIDKFLASPGGEAKSSGSLGNGTGLDAARINFLLEQIAKAVSAPPGPGLGLPAGLRLTAGGTDPVALTLATGTPLGNALSFSLAANIDSLMHVTPSGSLTLDLNATGAPVAVTFGASASGITLAVTIAGATIQLLPSFSGLGAFAVGAALLPKALDQLVTALGPPTALTTACLNLATALNLRAATFEDRSAQWKQLMQGTFSPPNWSSVFSTAAAAINAGVGLPGAITSSASGISWNKALSAPATGSVVLTLGWSGTAPTFSVAAQEIKASGGPLHFGLQCGFNGTAVQASLEAGLHLQSTLGVQKVPRLKVNYQGSAFEVHFYPLDDLPATKFDIKLLPSFNVVKTNEGLENLVKEWLVPIAGKLLFDVVAKPKFATQVWNGKTLQQLLNNAGLESGGNLVWPLPGPADLVKGLLKNLSGVGVDVGKMKVSFVADTPNGGGGTHYGIRLFGYQDIPAGNLKLSLRFGETAAEQAGSPSWITETRRGISMYLFNNALTFSPKLNVIGLGVEFTGSDGPLVSTDYLRIGQLAAFLFFDVNLTGAIGLQNFGAGLEMDEFGIPLGQALGGNQNGDNPVAAGLLKSDGGSGGGDKQPVNPAVNLWLAYRNNTFIFKINQTQALWIGIHKKFGPIYIDQIGLEVMDKPQPVGTEVALLVDGSVQISGLTVQADDLGVVIPLKSLASPGDWSLDLKGLAVSYDSNGVSIAGGLLKNPGPPVEYDGMLKVDIAGKGFTAVGGYSRPKDQEGDYTSLFIFVSLPITLGGPPFFFVTGLGGGAGINRRLLPPDITEVPDFFLVAAIDDGSFANDPMGALKKMAASVPSRRGSYWFAAGVRFDSFVLVHSIAVIYVALDKGFEIGVIGVSRMALPTADLAIVSVELALKARFSSAEGILSVQAQLTDNSYLFHPSCQLTGGFAFFAWFPKGQFVLTIGGYHPAFQKPPEFPVVPRLGFRWSVSDAIVIKGEAYFALTNTAVMAGGRLEASAHLGPVRAWFLCYADFLVSWDPFYYNIGIGIEIGLALDIEVCFIVCGHLHLEITKGAELQLMGPPLHGWVKTSILFVTVKIPFGPSAKDQPDYLEDFKVFRKKYLSAGDTADKVTGVRVTSGLLPPDPPGAKPSPGAKNQPWKMNVEFSFLTETRMPAASCSAFQPVTGPLPDVATIDLAAMHILDVTSNHDVRIYKGDTMNVAATDAAHFEIKALGGLFPEATWRWIDPAHIPAAARTISAISGLNIKGKAVLVGQSALIPIKNMVDDLKERARPLPFNTNTVILVATLKDYGVSANQILADVATASSTKMLEAASQVLSGNNVFSQMRVAVGAPASGLAPMSKRSLKKFRSAPPQVAPLTTGLTMDPVALAAPPVIYRVPDKGPVVLKSPRLRAVLQGRPQPAEDVPSAIRTTVFTIRTAERAPRMAPPTPLAMPGARLHLLRPSKAPAPTEAALGLRTLHNPETGILTGKAHLPAFQKAGAMVLGEGVVVPSGTTHVWDLPADGGFVLLASGNGAMRLVTMDRGGRVIFDREMMPDGKEIVLPPNAASFAVQCIGKPPAGLQAPAAAQGSITLFQAPAHAQAAVGWQSGGQREQVGALTVLGRGATMKLGKSSTPLHRGQKTSHTMLRISRATLGQTAVETRLPKAVSVVMILLDGQDPTSAVNGDLAVAAQGATLSNTPIPVGGGRRRAVLYDVSGQKDETFTVTAASKSGWQISGVVGLAGKAQEWAVRMHGDVPERMIPDGPLTPDGMIRVRLARPTSTTATTTPVKVTTTGTTGTIQPRRAI